MGSGYFEAGMNEDEKHRLVDPASCSSQTSFTLKRARSDANANSGTCPPQQIQTHADCSSGDEVKFTRALRRRPWVNYGKFDMSSDDDSDCQQSFQVRSSKINLPKGVIRGCSRCNDCQKVTARWRPEDGCRPVTDEAPVFYPNEEEFKDTLKYIASIRALAEPHGICRIVPPPSWQPPCPLRDMDKWQSARFPTRVQEIHKLQIRKPVSKKFRYANGGRRKRRRNSRTGRSCGRVQQCLSGVDGELLVSDEEGRFGFDSGSEFTLEAYERYANEFKEQYFGIREMNGNLDSAVLGESKTKWEPSVENIEGEYWRVIEKPTEEIEVLYGADVETGVFGSGFPKSTPGTQSSDADPYVESGWNLNNFARLPGSVLSYEGGDISGVLVPWLYLGMCFSSFCWHVEDHHFYSLNYMHWGAPKVWYGVPGSAAVQLEQAMRKHLPHLFDEQPDLLHKLVTQLSPTVLRAERVPVYRSVQKSGEFVLTFPRAYHAGFNCGFNCAEAVNVAPIDWLPHGQSAVELYRDQCRKTSVSHDKLLLGASREAVRSLWELLILRKGNLSNSDWQRFCGQDGILTKAMKTRVEMERARRVYLANPAKTRKMDHNFDATKERECLSCYYDLHLSAVGCECCPERFACLEHAKQMCKCAWERRFFLYRYDIAELDTLVEALGGKLNAIYRWATLDLGLSLSSCAGYPNLQSGFQFTVESLDVNSKQSKMDINSLLGESKTSFISMLNLASGANAGKIIPSAMQHRDSKLAGSAAALIGEIDCPRETHESEMPLGFPCKDTLLARASQTNAEDVMMSSAVQHQDSKLAGFTSAMVDENHGTETKNKMEIHMELPMRDKIPDINKPFSFEENDLCNKPELTLQAKAISNEEPPCDFFSCKSDNRKIPFPRESKIEGNCSSHSDKWPVINTKDENKPYDQPKQKYEPYFANHGPTSRCHMKSMAGFHGIRATDGQGQYEPEASLRGQGSTSVNDVECILLSDDDGGTEKSIGMEKRAKVMQNHLSVGIPESATSSGRTAVHNLATEKVSYRAVCDESETIGQTNEGNKISMLGMEQDVVSDPENIKECLRDESHAKQFDLIRETDFSDESNKKSRASKLPPFLDNSLIQMGASHKFHMAQGSVGEGSDIHPRYSIKSKITERIAVAGNIHPFQQYTSTTAGNNDMNAVSGFDFSWNHMTNERKVQSFLGSSSSDAAANSTKIIQNKGPRIARVVRVQKCSYEVEVMDLGVMRPFKSWYNSQVIFPKGFKSRVRFHSVLEPTQMCNYISEVLDAGLVGPLFKVIVEGCSTEVFIHVTVDKCWELVQERLNQEIRRQRSLGKQNLPSLQPPGSLNGLEMFGFASPSIIQAIEDLDRDHKCLEYWATRSTSGIKTYSSEKTDIHEEQNKGFNSEVGKTCKTAVLKNLLGTIDNHHELSTDNHHQGQLDTQNLVSTEKVHTVLKGLFKRASPDELWTLHKVLSSQYWSSNWKAAFKALVEELQNL